MKRVDINQARESLPELVHRAAAGEEIVITRRPGNRGREDHSEAAR